MDLGRHLDRTPEHGVRRRLHELAEAGGWVHHVGDLADGRVESTELHRPPTPLSRAERFSRLGRVIDPSVFGGPRVRLSARVPHHTAPQAYLVAWNPQVFLPFDDTVVWELPRGHQGSPLHGMDWYFSESPAGPLSVTVAIAGRSWPGMAGRVHVVAYRNAIRAEIPIGQAFASHTIDLAVPAGTGSLEVGMAIGAGVQTLTFRSASLGASLPVLEPAPP